MQQDPCQQGCSVDATTGYYTVGYLYEKIEITVGARKNGNPPPDAIVRGPRRVALYQIDAQPTSKNDRCQLHIQW